MKSGICKTGGAREENDCQIPEIIDWELSTKRQVLESILLVLKKWVYNKICTGFLFIHDKGDQLYSLISTWKLFCSHSKAQQTSFIANGAFCRQLTSAGHQATLWGETRSKLKRWRLINDEGEQMEHTDQKKDWEKAILSPIEYCSHGFDAAGQPSFWIRHFTRTIHNVCDYLRRSS